MSKRFANEYRFKNEELFEVWCDESDSDKKIIAVSTFIFDAMDEVDICNEYRKSIQEKVRKFCNNLSTKWKSSHRMQQKFKEKYHKWLDGHFIMQKYSNENHPVASLSAGRPGLPYQEKSTRSQRREASEVAEEIEQKLDLMVHATSMAARKRGNKDLAAILNETAKSPGRVKKMRTILFRGKKDPVPLSVDEALAFLYDNSFSKRQYINIRLENKKRNCDIYPKYDAILEAKKSCRPSGITATETTAKVPLQNLLEHTAKRIVWLQTEVIDSVISNSNENVIETEIIFSYGFDGSSGQSTYKQRFEGSANLPGSDCSLFATTLIPLRLQTNNKIILWNNDTPHSVRFCRPLKLEYIKETSEQILKEKQNLDNEISNLLDVNIPYENKIFKIKFKLVLTLIDGKVLNVLTKTTSSQRCPVCGVTPSQILKINDFQAKEFTPRGKENLCYGFSPLHAWIRFFECVIHISYRIRFKKWQVKAQNDKECYLRRKKEVQTLFWEQLALNVDKPKQGGSGNTNDGNTARRAFQEVETFAEVTGVSINLLQHLKIILITISCQFPVNLEKFRKFCLQTAQIFKEQYPWYPMPPTIHKILIHGKQILEQCVLPPGCLAEEASEAKNKTYKHDRKFHARKNSRSNNTEDIFNRAIETSDPLISHISLRNRLQKQKLQKLKLPPMVLALLCSPSVEPEPTTSTFTEETTDDEEDFDENYKDNEDTLPIFRHLDNLELDSNELY